jgi:hypothetical protein
MSNTELPSPGLRPLCELLVETGELTSIGTTPAGEIRLVPIVGGTFQGAELEGRVLGGGADWQVVRSDGTLEIRAHYLLETVQSERIELRSEGIRAGSPEVLARLARGELVPPSDYYFRTAIRFNTGAPRLARLNNLLAVCYGARSRQVVTLRVFELL